MKLNRFAALVLAAAAALSLTAAPASAVTFADLPGHWSRTDVEDVAGRGMVKGYTDGTFKPDNPMTCCEALLFCSRATGISEADKARIAADRAAELQELLPADMLSWASEEMAVCLETGILTPAELQAMNQEGRLLRSISRENLAMYLTRAMQLAPLAESLSSYTLTFTDAGSIAPALQPYVYLLTSYGIIQGNESGQFMPKSSLTRGEMATMLRRAVDFMAAQGIVTELPAYTTGSWVAGTITTAATGESGVSLLTLSSSLSGARSVTLPATAQIYENNMLTTPASLRTGKYARVNFNAKGTAISVRLSGALETLEGSVASLTEDQILLGLGEEGTATRLLSIDRFTEVQVGAETGDASLIDLGAGYTEAVCQVDEMGHLASLRLSGGTREERGLIAGVTYGTDGNQILQVTNFDGSAVRYAVPAGASVTVNGMPGLLSSLQAGKLVTLRVSNETGEITAASVDTAAVYVQGGVKSVDYERSGSYAIVLSDPLTNKAVTYYMDPNALISYNGASISFREVRTGWFATLLLSDSTVLMLEAYPGSSTVDGVISAITYGVTTTIDVTLADQSVTSYTLDMNSLPPIFRGGKSSTVDKLRIGDTVAVTVRYNRVEEIDATPQSANVSGSITRITMESRGITLELALVNGESAQYEIAEGVGAIQNGQAISIYDLKPGYQVSMVVASGEVVSIEVDRANASDGMLTGVVLYTDTAAGTILLGTGAGNNTVVTVSAAAAELRETNGSAFSFRNLEVGDTLQVFGSYSGASFTAAIIIRT